MSYMPRLDAATTADWPDLAAELDRWGEAGRVALLWWRDDDAVTATPMLANLLRIAGSVPVALAVVPAFARPDLAETLRDVPSVVTLQHGWRHLDRSPGGKKSEYPEHRHGAAVADELGQGRSRLADLFGPRALPVFVPPWNRIAPNWLPLLVESGLTALSTMSSPRPPQPPGLRALDVHVDVTDWRGNRGFAGTALVLRHLIGSLRESRLAPDAAQPVGILTHHLVADSATLAFLDRLGAVVEAHPAVRWAAIDELPQ